MAVRLFVGNLPYDTTESEVREHFAQIGPLSFVSLPTDRETGKLRGFAFVEYGDRAHAESAISRFDGQLFKGRRLAVNEAREREPGSSHGAAWRPSAPRLDSGSGSAVAPPTAGTGRGAASFGPDAPPKRARKKPKKGGDSERRPKKPIPEVSRGRYFGGDEYDQEEQVDDDAFEENFASRLNGSDDEEDV
jgi:cold-inducible RNA-binding protein